MLKTDQLRQYLTEYSNLAMHQNPQLKQHTALMMVWQKQRLTQFYTDLFTAQHQKINEFLFTNFYDLSTLEMLAAQLQKALDQKIKLDRWLPNEILNAILDGFELALTTLTTDSQITAYLLEHQLDVNHENVLEALQVIDQFEARAHQLNLLAKIAKVMHKFAHSFILRSALKFAQPKIEQRGFKPLYDYLDKSMQYIRTDQQSLRFFKTLVEREKVFLNYLRVEQPSHLYLTYDAKINTFIEAPRHNTDMC